MGQVDKQDLAEKLFLELECPNVTLIKISGEVQIHRLNWQRVWNLPPPKEDDIVRAMAWRPDGKVNIHCGIQSGRKLQKSVNSHSFKYVTAGVRTSKVACSIHFIHCG